VLEAGFLLLFGIVFNPGNIYFAYCFNCVTGRSSGPLVSDTEINLIENQYDKPLEPLFSDFPAVSKGFISKAIMVPDYAGITHNEVYSTVTVLPNSSSEFMNWTNFLNAGKWKNFVITRKTMKARNKGKIVNIESFATHFSFEDKYQF
jgi:hypothetical protein